MPAPVVLPDDRYLFTNVEFSNVAALLVPDEGAPLTSNPGGPNAITDENNIWNLTRLANGKYTIQNDRQLSFASVGNDPIIGDSVRGSKRTQQWSIEQQGNNYVISDTVTGGLDLYWGLTSADIGVQIQVSDDRNAPRNQWIITPVQ
ncbi:hypothetical protein VNI00_010186 [Paramarasmius palmivorus]|uniref:Ricin B lectin domain-containing protein n=1 Tax=Paramarasmius palmivorus TaxID=297713 RepID=A0AAW0CJ10_9AGAR